jgi:integrase
MVRTIKGSKHTARITKEKKTGNVRYLPSTDQLRELLIAQVSGRQPNDFVFHSPGGLSIIDQMLEKRVLKPLLKILGLGDGVLYAARHFLGTRGMQHGMVITDVEYLMGHSTIETTMRNYVSVGKPTSKLPSISRND